MISKAQIKFIRSLHQKKYRKQHLLFIAEGTKVAHDIINSSLKVRNLYASNEWLAKNAELLAKNKQVETNEISEKELEQLSGFATAPEVVLLVEMPVYENTTSISGALALAVESIRDPGNLGTIIRICDWYGISRLFCSEDCADAYNPKTVQASMGSIARVEVIYASLPVLISKNKTYKSYAATLGGKINIHTATIKDKVLLVIGNEAHGISDGLLGMVDDTIMIPRFGEAESLNASIAAAVLVDNLVRLKD